MKRKILLIVSLVVICSHCYAAVMSKTETRVSVNDGTTNVEDSGLVTKYFGTGAMQFQVVSLSSGFNNISIPSGAKGVFIDISADTNMILKGVTADKGISLDSNCPVLFPISADGSTTFGITNLSGSTQQIKVFFL